MHIDEQLHSVDERGSVLRNIATGLEKSRITKVRWHLGPFGKGRIRKPHSFTVNYADAGKNPCAAPVTIYRTGRPLRRGGQKWHNVSVNDPQTVPRIVEMIVPCRKCEPCLKRRGQHWYFRALSETKAAARTWFGTLTLSPAQHAAVATACRLHASQNGDDFDKWSATRQFAARHKCISREITLYLKRLRKQSGEEFRFCLVAEEHKTGLPHYHLLVHEREGHPIRHAVLTKQWRIGFSNFRLVADPKAAGYVTKYLAKSSKARVRASLDYGNTVSNHSLQPEQLHNVRPLTYEGRDFLRGGTGGRTAPETSTNVSPHLTVQQKGDYADGKLRFQHDQTFGGMPEGTSLHQAPGFSFHGYNRRIHAAENTDGPRPFAAQEGNVQVRKPHEENSPQESGATENRGPKKTRVF